jgi:hypothetical protein
MALLLAGADDTLELSRAQAVALFPRRLHRAGPSMVSKTARRHLPSGVAFVAQRIPRSPSNGSGPDVSCKLGRPAQCSMHPQRCSGNKEAALIDKIP